jgi:hypothetical protein
MKRIHLALASRNGPDRRDGVLGCRKEQPSGFRFDMRMNVRAISAATVALLLMSNDAFAQTTRTSPSSASTSPTISSSSATSPNSPCSATNPSSPCYSPNAPRNPCYSAAAPDEPCSNTVTPSSGTSQTPSQSSVTTPRATARAFTEDQAKSQIEAKGYSNVSGLRKDPKGIWRGKAEKDGSPVNVILEVNGNVTIN